MNIFVLDEDPEKAAQYHCDRHLSKMVLEYAQILSTAAWKANFHDPQRMYKPVPNYNPVVHDWAAESRGNFVWLLKLAKETYKEYEYRYGPGHGSYDKVISKMDLTDVSIPDDKMTQWPICMPDIYKVANNPVESYRKFYIHGKGWDMSWYKREAPDWYTAERRNLSDTVRKEVS